MCVSVLQIEKNTEMLCVTRRAFENYDRQVAICRHNSVECPNRRGVPPVHQWIRVNTLPSWTSARDLSGCESGSTRGSGRDASSEVAGLMFARDDCPLGILRQRCEFCGGGSDGIVVEFGSRETVQCGGVEPGRH